MIQAARPRILMFAPLCYPPAGSEAIVTSKLVLAMLEAGWVVDVISQADFGHYYPVAENNHWKPLRSVLTNVEGLKIKGFLEWFCGVEGTSLTRQIRPLSWVMKAALKGIIASARSQYDFILSRAAPQYGHLPAFIVSRIMGTPWISNWSDPMPPQKAPPPYGGGIKAKSSTISNLYCKTIVGVADWHTFPCERLMKYYSKIYPELEGKSSVIPHIALGSFRMQSEEEKHTFSLCHTGSITLRDPAVFFEGVRRFLDKTKPSETIRIKFIGHPVDEILRKVEESGISDIVLVEPPKTYEETQSEAAKSSVLVVIEAPCEEGIFFPSKFVDFVQTGRPILAVSPRNGTMHDILSAYGGGIAVDCRSASAVASAIEKFYKEWETGTLDEKFGSARLFDFFSEQRVLESYMEIHRRVQGLRNSR